jgi:hypothetical protein
MSYRIGRGGKLQRLTGASIDIMTVDKPVEAPIVATKAKPTDKEIISNLKKSKLKTQQVCKPKKND